MAHRLTTPRSKQIGPLISNVARTNILLVAIFLLVGSVGYSLTLSVGARVLDSEATYHAFTPPIQRVHTPVCEDFFTVLADVWVKGEKNCTEVYDSYKHLLEEHDEHMGVMGSKFTVYTTWSEEALQDEKCAHYFDYLNHTTIQQFDPEALLQKHGYSDQQIGWMKTWEHTVPRMRHAVTRLSDIFRVVLQKEHRMAYADMDVVYLMDDKRVYLDVPNVAVPVWSEEKGALEIQNSAFCFTEAQLDVLMNKARSMMDGFGDAQLKHNKYMYTGLGPNLFQRSIQKLTRAGPLNLYYTHSDDHWKIEDVARLHERYERFVWLHLDGSNRRRNWHRNKKSYRDLVTALKEVCPPPNVTEILPSYIVGAPAANTGRVATS